MKILPKPQKCFTYEGTTEKKTEYFYESTLPKEGYRLKGDEKGIRVYYSDDAGRFYAEKTLEQMFCEYGEELPRFEITDSPKYRYRGFMMDCSRHFFTVEEIKKQLDLAAAVKLNRFHWHLTDDQGWRIEIKKYPLLTETGSVRRQTRGDGKEVKGVYSQQQIKDIVDYCRERYIEVVPEIDMPGHFTAAIAAYPFLSCTEDKISVSEHFGIHSEIACAGKESTYRFVTEVLDEVIGLFPGKYIHIGGDEALKYRYLTCPHCQKAIVDNNLADEEELQGYFMNRIIKYLNERGKRAVVWNDGALGGNLTGDYCVQYWKESKLGRAAAKQSAEQGKRIIYSPFSKLYLDYPHGMTPLKKTFGCKGDDELGAELYGLEAPVWAEYIPDITTWEKQAYPRLWAVADSSWNGSDDYSSFLVRAERFRLFATERYGGVTVCDEPDPLLLRGKGATIRFFIRAFDPSYVKFLSMAAKTRRLMKKRKAKRQN